jgi:cadmium resistance protein CadD (predicted permease)
VLAAIGTSLTTFAATNVDDLFLLSVFFARRQPTRRVMAGQYLGFAGIVVFSLLGLLAALATPVAWFRFLGFLPLAIGIKRLFHLRKAEALAASSFNVFSIAAITLANGADNVGVYIPFFAVSSAYLGLILASYMPLLPVWCIAGKWLGERPRNLAIRGPLWSLDRADDICRSWTLHPDLAMATDCRDGAAQRKFSSIHSRALPSASVA